MAILGKMAIQGLAARLLSRSQKDFIHAMRWRAGVFKRGWRRLSIERRMPDVQGRSWRTKVPVDLQISLVNGAMKYTYRGVRMVKHPIDLALYMKLLYEVSPKTVIELGSKDGGTAIWFGDMMSVFGIAGSVVSIDLQPPNRPWCAKPHVQFVRGDEGNLSPLKALFHDLPHPWILINDASHNANTMLLGMRYLHQFLEKGDYFIIEDSFLTEAGLDWDGERNGGPGLAILKFLQEHPACYEIDARYCDHFGRNVTANQNGYLRRL